MKMVALAGIDSDIFEELCGMENAFVVGADNSRLTPDGYVQVVEMLDATLRLYEGKNMRGRYPTIRLEKHKKHKNVHVLIPVPKFYKSGRSDSTPLWVGC